MPTQNLEQLDLTNGNQAPQTHRATERQKLAGRVVWRRIRVDLEPPQELVARALVGDGIDECKVRPWTGQP